MFVLGIQGSPRKNGNSDFLLTSFLKECQAYGAETQIIRPGKFDIQPCRELIVCEKKGFCPIKDEMEEKGYSLVRKADVVVLASPVFFYNVTAQAKVFIDRCQMFWGRKYKLKLVDPDSYYRQGFLLSVGASGGKRLFEGVELTGKYFFDAISADYAGSLTYKNVEDSGDIISRPELLLEIQEAARHLLEPLGNKKRLLFVSQKDACRSQMAAAFVKASVKGRVNVITAGYDAAEKIDPDMVKVMAEKNLDLKYCSPLPLDKFLAAKDQGKDLDMGIMIGSEKTRVELPGEATRIWDIPRSKDNSMEDLRKLRDEIESRVKRIIPFL
ncbi:MAG: NAD(P)H-dependent oxidoreductase [Desulfobacula sp.]|nr:NAD(P)H-dependent oxidoreductase [Desulfobacula sp.]